MATPILDIPELANGQVDQYLTANEAFRLLEAASNDVLAVDLDADNVTLTAAQLREHAVFACFNNAVARTLTVPAQKRLFLVSNSGSEAVSVVVGSTSIDVTAGQMRTFVADGTTNGLFVAS